MGIVSDAASFLAGDGAGLVARTLRRYGLPVDLHDDVVQEVLLRALREERRWGDADYVVDPTQPEISIYNPAGFTTTMVQRTVLDMIRGHLRRPDHDAVPLGPGLDDDEGSAVADLAVPGGFDADVLAAADLAGLRAALARSFDQPHPEAVAGALVILSVAIDGALPADDVPAPKGGVHAEEAVAWAGVFYGGAASCFPGDGVPEDAAMRKRRSRALARQREALQDAASSLGLGEAPHDG